VSVENSSADSPVGTVVTRTTFIAADLAAQANNHSMSPADNTGAGGFNVWGNSFPAQHLPAPGSLVTVGGVPFVFGTAPAFSGGDNVRCSGQFVDVPPGRYDWVHVLAASERRTEDTVALHFADGHVDFEALRVSDFWAQARPAFGECKAFETPVMHYPHHVQQRVQALMWAQRMPVPRRATLTGVRLPRNVAIHVFAMTLQSTGEEQ
jgi:hypothetical protein